MNIHFVDVRDSFNVERAFMVRAFAARGFERDGTHSANAAHPHLDGLPKFKGLAGPFPDRGGARYETWAACELLSS